MIRKSLIAVAALSTGCVSTGFVNQDDSVVRMQAPANPEVDAEIAKVQAVRPQLKFPCRVAVHFVQPGGTWRWNAADKARLEEVAKKMKEAGIASDVFVLSHLTLANGEKSSDIMQLRMAAARHGADILCVFQGISEAHTTKNFASVLNPTIVGGFVVPGSTCEARFTAAGAVVDVRNGYLYAAVESEEEATIYRPTFTLEESSAIEKAKARAMERFAPAWCERMLSLKEVFGGPPRPVYESKAGLILTPLLPLEGTGPVLEGPELNPTPTK